ncbi:hypothetical protein FRB91_011591 [Serendipita sp. 411]|nr:hypothetical protein FRC19_000604 [Serendipita sp. 401]KAG8847610.1 hypothetical protein FRB91_011591 [Serendipita sp. 411]
MSNTTFSRVPPNLMAPKISGSLSEEGDAPLFGNDVGGRMEGELTKIKLDEMEVVHDAKDAFFISPSVFGTECNAP